MEHISNVVLELIISTVYGSLGLGPLVVVIVALLKRVLKNTPSNQILMGTVILLFFVGTVLQEVGYLDEFKTVTGSVITILTAFLSTTLSAPAMYKGLKQFDVPVLGQSRHGLE